MMQRIILFLFVTCLSAMSNGQQQPDPPRIVNFTTKDLTAPEDVKGNGEKNVLKLPCDAVGNNLQWTWKHNGSVISTGHEKFTIDANGTLYGSYLESAQSGHYQCYVRDNVSGIETFSRKIQVAVTVLGTFNNQTTQEKPVDLGQEFTAECPPHSPSYGVRYSWQGKVNNANIQLKRTDRRAITLTGQLFIMYITQADLDDFADYENQGIRCFMSAAKRYEFSGLLKLTKRVPGQTDPQTLRAPSWKLIPAVTENAVEGRNKTFYCLASGRPAPTITWKIFRGGNWENLVHGEGNFEIPSAFHGRLLVIIAVDQNTHQTSYRCEANNSQSGGSPIVHEMKLKVEVAPRWKAAPPQEITIDVNDNASLTCDVFADPAPSFKWYKNGNRINTSTVHVTLNGKKLDFKNVRYPIEAGVYQCVAENPYGMIVSSTWVRVLIPGPPSEVNIYAFAKYILVTWEAPVKPKGVIRRYRVGSAQYNGSQPSDDLQIEMEEVGPGVHRKLLKNQTPGKNYVVEIQAETSKGWGEKVRKTTRTVKYAPPAKPKTPTVERIAVDKLRVTYNFGLGGGYTHEFLVMYRKKLEGETFQNTSWVNHFETQSIEIGNLTDELYELKTVGRNDYPDDNDVNSKSESPASNVTEGRPLRVQDNSQRSTTSTDWTPWLIALLVLIAVLLIVLIIFELHTRHPGAKYPVGKREKRRGVDIEYEPYDKKEGALSNAGQTETPPPYQSEGSQQGSPDSGRDSLG